MTRLLVVNDDGIAAAGLAALVEAVTPLGEVWVVAPETDHTAGSHALTLAKPLRVREAGPRRFAIDGTPADCVYVALTHLLADQKPTLVLAGINHGANLAEDVIYSGTVAAAMEGRLLGVPSIAFSLVSRHASDFTLASAFARTLVSAALAHPVPKTMLLNVNIPGRVAPEGVRITSLGRHTYGAGVIQKEDPRGRPYFWIGGTGYEHEPIPGTDCTAVHDERCISITPLQLDLTDRPFLEVLSTWKLEVPAPSRPPSR